MSTRAVYTFKATNSGMPDFSVYKHHDGYPSGAAEAITKTLPLAWPLPRYENDEFSAAFVAANKNGGGSVRLTTDANAHGDLAFRYEISLSSGSLSSGSLSITAYESDGWNQWALAFTGTLAEFATWANDGRCIMNAALDQLRYVTAAICGLAMRHTSFRFSKAYRHGESAFHRAVYVCVSTVAANYVADGLTVRECLRWGR